VEKGTRPAMPSCGTVVGAASDPDIEFFLAEKSDLCRLPGCANRV
jgi:hypothetical protein